MLGACSNIISGNLTMSAISFGIHHGPSRRKNRKAVIIGSLMIVTGLVFGYVFLAAHVNQFMAARYFVPVKAAVLSTRVISTARARHNPARIYSIKVEYRYRIKGRDYRSDRYAFINNDRFTDPLYAKRTAARFPKGAGVTVYVDPANPARAVIDNRYPRSPWLLLVLPVLFTLFGILVVLFGLGKLPAKG